MLLPENLVLPRTVGLELVNMDSKGLEISNIRRTESYRWEVLIYSTLRGDIADLVELFYTNLHGGDDVLNFPNEAVSFGLPTGEKMRYDNFFVKYFFPFSIGDKNVYSASIRFDAVVTRRG
jgi:hypothetical protein